MARSLPLFLRTPLHLLIEHPWGGASLISLFLSILSGIVLGLQYDPTEPFYSTSTIELAVPYGSFWRSLHYFSSQAFFLLLLVHLAVVLWNNTHNFRRSAWVRLMLSLPCAILLLFTGYVLRGDATGEAAGAIAEHICLSIPLLGTLLNDLLFDLADSGLRKVYLQHVVGLVVLGGVTAWPHLRRYTARWRDHLPLTAGLLALSFLCAAPVEPVRFGLLFIAGPWFFLGLQELLRFLPPLVAGVCIPLLPLILLCALPKAPRSRRALVLALIGLWLLVYAICSFLCLARV
ncbi:MAG: cytochrome b N-terminal domain-containing protein [Desulfobulbus sp.]|jgi:ubiquinol-cytochrome c reductase cytochrome b subunit